MSNENIDRRVLIENLQRELIVIINVNLYPLLFVLKKLN